MNTENMEAIAKQFRLYYGGPEKLKELGMTCEFLVEFYEKTKNKTFPGSYGQSPYDDAFSLAYALVHGVSPSSREYYKKNSGQRDIKNRLACFDAMGIDYEPQKQMKNQPQL